MPVRVRITLSVLALLLEFGVKLSAQSQPVTAQCGDKALVAAKSALRTNNNKAAIHILSKARKECPADNRPLVELGRAFLYSKRDDRAIALFREVLRVDAGDRTAKLELARALGYRQRFAESDDLYKELLQTTPPDEAAALGLVRNLFHEHKMSQARVQADQALLFHPNSIRLQQYRNELDQDPPRLSTILHPEGIPTGSDQIQNWTAFLSDSSGHQMLNSLQRLTYNFNDTFSTRVEIGDRYLQSTRSRLGSESLFSGLAELRARLNQAVSFAAGLGGVRFSDGHSLALYRAHLDYQPAERLWTYLEVERHPVAPTAEAARFHVAAQGISLGADWRPSKWQFKGLLARHSYSDGNYRKEETFEGLRWFGATRLQFGAGYGFRHLAFDQQLLHGYFSPAQYQNHAFVTGIRFRAGKHYRAEYMTHLGAESFIQGDYRFSAEISFQNRWQFNKWEFIGDYLYYHVAQSTGAFRANVFRFGLGYRF
jgi:tetratricopeptide (TPR) repeat protein